MSQNISQYPSEAPSRSAQIGAGKRIKVLLWKCFVMKKRRGILLCLELLLPAIVVLLLSIAKSATSIIKNPEQHYVTRQEGFAGYNTLGWGQEGAIGQRLGEFSREFDGSHMAFLPNIVRTNSRKIAFIESEKDVSSDLKVFLHQFFTQIDRNPDELFHSNHFYSKKEFDDYLFSVEEQGDFPGGKDPVFAGIQIEKTNSGILDITLHLNGSTIGGKRSDIYSTLQSTPREQRLAKAFISDFVKASLDGAGKGRDSTNYPAGGFLDLHQLLMTFLLERSQKISPVFDVANIKDVDWMDWRDGLYNYLFSSKFYTEPENWTPLLLQMPATLRTSLPSPFNTLLPSELPLAQAILLARHYSILSSPLPLTQTPTLDNTSETLSSLHSATSASLPNASELLTSLSWDVHWLLQQHSALSIALNQQLGSAVEKYIAIKFRETSFPTQEYQVDQFLEGAMGFMGIIFILTMSYLVNSMLRVFVGEKEKGHRVLMRTHGIKNSEILFGWIVIYFVIITVMSLIWMMASKFLFFADIPWGVQFLMYFLFGLTVLSFSLLWQTAFSTAKMAGILGFVLFIVFHFPFDLVGAEKGVSFDNAPVVKFIILALFCPANFSEGVYMLARIQSNGQELKWSNLSDKYYNSSILNVFYAFLINFVFYLGLAFLIEWLKNRSPSPKPSKEEETKSITQEEIQRRMEKSPEDFFPNDYFEKKKMHYDKVRVFTHHLNKNYKKKCRLHSSSFFSSLNVSDSSTVSSHSSGETPGRKIPRCDCAVADSNIAIEEGEIFVLLGENGAGKSTTYGMLSGMTSISQGDGYLDGVSCKFDGQNAHHKIGICHQKDIFFDELTVRESILFTSYLSGVGDTEEECEQQINETLQFALLHTHKNHFTTKLSGGQQRRLSIALSFVGNKKIVFLDEPTTGVDTSIRHYLWERIKAEKKRRAIVLTTHFMEEADFLGDRIAIMRRGRVLCCGTNLFLKKKFMMGYNLMLFKKSDSTSTRDEILTFLKKYIQNFKVVSDVSFLLVAQFALDNPNVHQTLVQLESNSHIISHVSSYQLSVSPLDDIFLKALEQDAEQERLEEQARNQSFSRPPYNSSSSEGSSPSPSPSPTQENHPGPIPDTKVNHCKQFRGNFLKLCHKNKRDALGLFCRFLLPAIYILIALIFLSTDFTAVRPMKLNVDPNSSLTTPFLFPPSSPSPSCESKMNSLSSYQNLALSSPSPLNSQEFSESLLSLAKASAPLSSGAYVFHQCDLNTMDVQADIFYDSHFTTSLSSYLLELFNTLLYPSEFLLSVASFPTKALKAFTTTTLSIFFGIGLGSSLPSLWAFAVVRERELKVKHVLFLSGLSPTIYWLSNFLFDALLSLLPLLLSILLLFLFSVTALIESHTIAATVLLLLAYILTNILFTYLLSFLFDEAPACQTFFPLFNILTGPILSIVGIVLFFLPDTTELYVNVLQYIFLVFPTYGLCQGLTNLVLQKERSVFGSDLPSSPFERRIIGNSLIYFLAISVASLLLILLIETIGNWGFFHCLSTSRERSILRKSPPAALPKDVQDERNRVLSQKILSRRENLRRSSTTDSESSSPSYPSPQASTRGAIPPRSTTVDSDDSSPRQTSQEDSVTLLNVHKVYLPSRHALRDVCFGLKKRFCFGFLGANGAGKSTCIKILAHEQRASQGNILFHDIQKNQIGYCPQVDALIPELTPRELLSLYCKVRGFDTSTQERLLSHYMRNFCLDRYENTPIQELSGGNRRKVSIAASLIGSPKLLLLDEPSSGIDIASKKFIWGVIHELSERIPVVLTTHSMEECEALCQEMTIMREGRMLCYGGIGEIKERYADGLLQVTVILEDLEGLDGFWKKIREKFVAGVEVDRKFLIKENGFSNMTFFVRGEGVLRLSTLFEYFQVNQKSLGLTFFAVSHVTLEYVFIKILREDGEFYDIQAVNVQEAQNVTEQSSRGVNRKSITLPNSIDS